ncbi:MAG TPA: alpha/beta hydrolase [Anaerolineales bacterium]|nr:alpha/beta hydrolase [Anaerolineales bacterium]
MKSTINDLAIPTTANFVQQGNGTPVVLVHGVAASLRDWDDLTPALVKNGYASYALDLLGHGDSPKPASRAYHIDWVFEHFLHWITSLRLTEPAIIIGHSLGGYIALEYARRFPALTRGLILVNPLYSLSQLPFLLRRTYRHPSLSSMISLQLPEWIFRLVIDVTSIGMGHSSGAIHALPEHVRAQTALDYTRTASGVYNIPNTLGDLTGHLSSMSLPALVVWGSRDQTLAPSSFPKLVEMMPRAEGKTIHAGHVPHQSNAKEFNEMTLDFLSRLQ